MFPSQRSVSIPAGLWSQIKRAPKASIKRKTFEAPGPAKEGENSLDARASQIFMYFKKYNYDVKDQGETITFSGTYAASRGQAAALVFYVFCGKHFVWLRMQIQECICGSCQNCIAFSQTY